MSPSLPTAFLAALVLAACAVAKNADEPDVEPTHAKPPALQALTPRRIWLALAVALIMDGIQVLAGPAGWVGFDQVVDVVAMIATSLLLGFHPLLLPTFVAELVPGLHMLPTWIACVVAVVALRRRSQGPRPPAPPGPPAAAR